MKINHALPFATLEIPLLYVPLRDPVLILNKRDKKHASVVSIRNNVRNERFELQPVSPIEIWNKIRHLDNSKEISECFSK